MGQASSIEKLPEDILKQLNELLTDPRCTQLDAVKKINEILQEQGQQPVSKSAVNRYAVRMNEVGQRLKERHQIAEMWVNKFGRLPQGQMGQLIIQILHGMAFDAGMKLSEVDMNDKTMPGAVSMLKDLSLMIQRIERASTINTDREKKIRQQVAEDAAKTVEKTMSSQGMSKESIDTLKREILGIA